MIKKQVPPFQLSDTEVIRAITDDTTVWNKARQIFRFRSVAIDGIGSPIEQRRQEFYAVLEIVQTILGEHAEKEFLDTILASAEKQIRESPNSTASSAVIAAATRQEAGPKRRR